jgi:hypothetical protein
MEGRFHTVWVICVGLIDHCQFPVYPCQRTSSGWQEPVATRKDDWRDLSARR